MPGGNLLEDVAAVTPSTSTSQVLTVDTDVTDTVVSEDPSTPIHLTSQQGKEVSVTLPYAETSETAVPVGDGVVSFANEQGFTSVPVVKEDGSAQVALMVESADAPERFPFQVGLPEGATAEVTEEDGGVVFTSAEGEFLGGLTPPWAKDVNGTELATRYEVEETSSGGVVVTQVIEHHSGGAAYPVVADPWLGIDLFGEAEYDRPETDGHGDVVLSVMLSRWGWYWYITGGNPPVMPPQPWTGQGILLTAGWDEVVDKLDRADDKPTIRHQYECHVALGYIVWAPPPLGGAGVHWDFEMARVNKPDWPMDILEHRCNWREYD
ncbi:hypothetical protein D4740_10615 [Actinomyces sp. 2119]|uniref:hypothetical protein n=1 Tax=Actinomyces sp. 2119 TaxID=2321393 RepID=UPI000E6C0A31|nr:hypothetical protein [Actinomyces sp. 2119]RJF40971.1 hypothetical protein D4740_10615 [Actinomyces sp. 2119]